MAEPTEDDLMAIQAAHAALQTIADNRFLRSDEGHIADYRAGTIRDAQRLAAFTLKRFTPVVCRLFADVGLLSEASPQVSDDGTPGVNACPTPDLRLLARQCGAFSGNGAEVGFTEEAWARFTAALGVTGVDGQSNSRESPMPPPDEQ